MKQLTASKYYLLYIPWLVSLLFSTDSILSYFIAWAGSFYIFYISFTNKVKPTSPEIPFTEKILRPLFLMQIIFAGYMACSSIFHFADELGYQYFTKIPGNESSPGEISLTAACQRYYVLGHAALVHGILVFYKPVISKYKPAITDWPSFFIKMVVICAPIGMVLSKVSGFSVLGGCASGLALGAATIGFALSIPLRDKPKMAIAGFFYAISVVQALTSGFKEPVIVSVLMLGIFLLPFYKRTILVTFVPLMLFLFTVLPTYVNTFRHQAWSGDADAQTAKQEALKKVREDLASNNLAETNWAFLTGRISEIGLFTRYKESMDAQKEYYGFRILGQSLISLIPRLIWKNKPITENMVMLRAYENGVIAEDSKVSAKPQYIVDGYLSGGIVGIWIALFFYGAIAQVICNRAEQLFGGYFFGIAFVYTAMFRILWRGNCFEFIFNDIFWSFIGLYFLFFVFQRTKVLVKIEEEDIITNEEHSGALAVAK